MSKSEILRSAKGRPRQINVDKVDQSKSRQNKTDKGRPRQTKADQGKVVQNAYLTFADLS